MRLVVRQATYLDGVAKATRWTSPWQSPAPDLLCASTRVRRRSISFLPDALTAVMPPLKNLLQEDGVGG